MVQRNHMLKQILRICFPVSEFLIQICNVGSDIFWKFGEVSVRQGLVVGEHFGVGHVLIKLTTINRIQNWPDPHH